MISWIISRNENSVIQITEHTRNVVGNHVIGSF